MWTKLGFNNANRRFGFLVTAVFAAVGLYPLLNGEQLTNWAMYVGSGVCLLAIFLPNTLEWPNKIWLKFGLFLKRILSPVILHGVFYGVITPIALVSRLAGNDTLILKKPSDKKETYWINLGDGPQEPFDMGKQF